MKKGIISAVALVAIIYATQVKTYALNPNVTQENIQQTICVSGWTKTVRPPVSYTNKIKLDLLKQSNYADKDPKNFELDHALSIEDGGNPTDPSNLALQPYTNIVDGINLGAHQKDVVETFLNRQICSGKITLKEGQDQLINHWAEIYLKLKGYDIQASDTDD